MTLDDIKYYNWSQGYIKHVNWQSGGTNVFNTPMAVEDNTEQKVKQKYRYVINSGKCQGKS